MAADIMTTPRTAMTVMIITRSESPSTAPVKKHYKDCITNIIKSVIPTYLIERWN